MVQVPRSSNAFAAHWVGYKWATGEKSESTFLQLRDWLVKSINCPKTGWKIISFENALETRLRNVLPTNHLMALPPPAGHFVLEVSSFFNHKYFDEKPPLPSFPFFCDRHRSLELIIRIPILFLSLQFDASFPCTGSIEHRHH